MGRVVIEIGNFKPHSSVTSGTEAKSVSLVYQDL